MTTWQFIVGISEKFSQTIWRTNIWDCNEFEFWFYGGTFWFKSSTLWQTLSLHLNIMIDWQLQRPLLSHIWAFQGTGTTKRVNVVKNDILYLIGKSEPCQFTNNKVRRCVGAHPDKTYWSNDFNFTQFQLLKVCFISTVFLTANMEVKKTLSFELLKERDSASLLYWHSTSDQTKHVATLFFTFIILEECAFALQMIGKAWKCWDRTLKPSG